MACLPAAGTQVGDLGREGIVRVFLLALCSRISGRIRLLGDSGCDLSSRPLYLPESAMQGVAVSAPPGTFAKKDVTSWSLAGWLWSKAAGCHS